MMKKVAFLLIVIFCSSSVIASPLDVAGKRLYKENLFLSWLNEPTFPTDDSIEQLCQGRENILKAAAVFKVKPEVLASCLLAERSLEFNLADLIMEKMYCPLENQKTLTSQNIVKLEKKADQLFEKVLKREIKSPPSLGVPQISLAVAFKIRKEVLKKNKKVKALFPQETSRKVICAELNSAKHWPYYLAAVGASIQKPWKGLLKRKNSVAEQSAIYCTMYSQGNWENKAVKRKKKTGAPQSNFYGFFAEVHMPLSQELLQPNGCLDPEQARQNHSEMIEEQI